MDRHRFLVICIFAAIALEILLNWRDAVNDTAIFWGFR